MEFVLGIPSDSPTDLQPGYLLAFPLDGGGISPIFSEIRSDPSNRVRDSSSRTLDPITEISFDDIAYGAPPEAVKLDQVVQIDWMSHLGRPLYVYFGYYFTSSLLPNRVGSETLGHHARQK